MTDAVAPLDGRAARFAGLTLIAVAVAAGLALSAWANSDLAAGRHVLFMDEQLSYDGVRHILHPRSAKGFVLQVLDGGDHRYGRIFWNASALVAAPFEKYGGPTWQIIATRWLAAVTLLVGYLILAVAVVPTPAARALALWLLLCMPSTPYFMSLPRPESLQILFLALFMYFAARKRFAFGWHWLFLGLAFGTKISALPAVAFLGLVGLVRERSAVNSQERVDGPHAPALHRLQHLFRGIAALALAAFAVYALATKSATPEVFGRYTIRRVLIIVITLGIAALIARPGRSLDEVKRWLWNRRIPIGSPRPLSRVLLAAFAFIAGFLMAEPVPLFGLSGLRTWYEWTLLNTAHGSDDAGVQPFTWLQFMVNEWMNIPRAGVILFGAAILLVFIRGCRSLLRSPSPWSAPAVAGVVMILAGGSLIVPIILAVQRVWPIYLHPGMVFIATGAVSLLDVGLRERSQGRSGARASLTSALPVAVLFVLLRLPHTVEDFATLARRTAAPAYQRQLSEYKGTVALYSTASAALGRQLRVLGDPMLFTPDSNPRFSVVHFWGYLGEWPKDADLVVVYERMTPDGPLPPPSSANHAAAQISRERFQQHVVEMGDVCRAQPCFRPVPFDQPCVRVYARDEVARVESFAGVIRRMRMSRPDRRYCADLGDAD